ncbi:hypothetical protein ACJMK2_007817 [Sinanodonta woodiana]|uniref:Uncharacterized protein n=1 Tax=Sinanodonta woodiana TaxID=1069815 RepID=A0ABD3VJN3_SINWO
MSKRNQMGKHSKANLGGKPGPHGQPPMGVPGGWGHRPPVPPNLPPMEASGGWGHSAPVPSNQPPREVPGGWGNVPPFSPSQPSPYHPQSQPGGQAGPHEKYAFTQQPPPTALQPHRGFPGYGTHQSGPMLPPPGPNSQHVPPPSTHQFPRFSSQPRMPPAGQTGFCPPQHGQNSLLGMPPRHPLNVPSNLNTNQNQQREMGTRKGSGQAGGQRQGKRWDVEKDGHRDNKSSGKNKAGVDHRGRGRGSGRGRGQDRRKRNNTDEKNIEVGSECGNEENDESEEECSDSEDTDTEIADKTQPESHDREPTEPPEENAVFEYLIKEVGGPISLKNIAETKLFPKELDIPSWFRSHQRRFIMFENKEKNYQFIVPFYREATFCFDYNRLSRKEKCDQSDCLHAHVCKDFISGSCKQGQKCPLSHNFYDRANAGLISKLGLDIFSNEEIQLIYNQRFPHVCGKHTPTRICRLPACAYLHICINNLFGRCDYGSDCKLSHTFETEQNKSVLKAYQIADWNEPLIRNVIFLSAFTSKENRDPKDISPHGSKESISDKRYISQNRLNKQAGSTSNISNEQKSTFYVTSKISDVKKGHRKSSPSPIPESHRKYSADKTENFNKEQMNSRKKEEKPSRKGDHGNDKASKSSIVLETDASQSTPICDLYLVDKCKTATCKFHHHESIKLPYIWQIQMFNSWLTLDKLAVIEAEKSFCNKKSSFQTMINYEGRNYSAKLDLDSMTAVVTDSGSSSFTINTSARRLSTKSYAEGAKPSSEDSFKTQWRWFCMDDFEICCLFEPGLMQFTLEQKFAQKCQDTYLYSSENYKFKYRIDFKSMEQINIETGVGQKLLRRPLFVSEEDVINKHYPEKIDFPNGVKVPLPAGWVPWDLAHAFELVELNRSSNEFKKVERSFLTTLNVKQFHTISICRVQNMELWMAYDGQRQSMKISLERAGQTKKVDERKLFHGTDSLDTVQGICTNSFDFRLSGKHGTALGKGAYFARDAKYSHRYTNGSSTTAVRYMFLAKVLVGEYTTGSPSYVRPPEKPDGTAHQLFDSCVDNVDSPALFVVFDLKQCYPEYLICYKSFEEFHNEEASLITLNENTTPSFIEQIQSLSILDQPIEPALDIDSNSSPVEKGNILAMFDPFYSLEPLEGTFSLTGSSTDNVGFYSENLPESSSPRSTDASSMTQGYGLEHSESRVKSVMHPSAEQESCCIQ